MSWGIQRACVCVCVCVCEGGGGRTENHKLPYVSLGILVKAPLRRIAS